MPIVSHPVLHSMPRILGLGKNKRKAWDAGLRLSLSQKIIISREIAKKFSDALSATLRGARRLASRLARLPVFQSFSCSATQK